MQLAEFALIASASQLCVAHNPHAHTHLLVPRHKHTPGCAPSSDVGCTPQTVVTRTTTSLLFVEADLDIQYQEVYTTMSAARQSMETSLGQQYRAGLQPTNISAHYHPRPVPSHGWTGIHDANSTERLGNQSSVHHPTFHATATPLFHSFLKPSISTGSAGGTPGDIHSFSSSGLHGKQRASRFAVLIIVLLLTGAALRICS